MMKKLMAVSLAAALGACGGGGDSPADPGVVRVDPTGAADAVAAYALTLSPDKAVHVAPEQLTVTLKDIKDSRCPAATACVTAGSATVSLAVIVPGFVAETVNIELSDEPGKSAGNTATVRDYRFVLRALTPNPPPAGVARGDYVASVELQRLKSGTTQ